MGGGRTSSPSSTPTNMAGAAALVVSDLAAVPFGLTHEFAHVFGHRSSAVVRNVSSTTTTTYSSTASTSTMMSSSQTIVENSSSTCSSSSTSSSSSGTSPSSVKKAGPDRVPRFVWRTLKKTNKKYQNDCWCCCSLLLLIFSLLYLRCYIFLWRGGGENNRKFAIITHPVNAALPWLREWKKS